MQWLSSFSVNKGDRKRSECREEREIETNRTRLTRIGDFFAGISFEELRRIFLSSFEQDQYCVGWTMAVTAMCTFLQIWWIDSSRLFEKVISHIPSARGGEAKKCEKK